MPDFLTSPFANGPQVAPLDVLARLLLALLFGVVIAWVYRLTRKSAGASLSFATTLVLLCVLIAMVTQVIGDNVARAFSLVGALSIVRFRTVVRDTQDTAYVILAVIVGMAVGSKSLWVAVIGIAVVALAECVFLLRSGKTAKLQPEFTLKVRTGLDQNLDALVSQALDHRVDGRELISMGTGKQGSYMEAAYRIRPRAGGSLPDLVSALNLTEGVQSVQLLRCGFDED